MCFYNDGDYDWTALSDVGVRTARKQHKCGDCRAFIEPGTKYHFIVGRDGESEPATVQTLRWCASCEALRQAIHRYEVEVEKCDEYEAWPPFQWATRLTTSGEQYDEKQRAAILALVEPRP